MKKAKHKLMTSEDLKDCLENFKKGSLDFENDSELFEEEDVDH